jgi:hypothetical protein
VGTATDLTLNGMQAAQYLANKMTQRSFEIIRLGDKTLIKGLTVDALGRQLAIVGLVVTAADMVNNGVNWKNGTDAGVGLICWRFIIYGNLVENLETVINYFA